MAKISWVGLEASMGIRSTIWLVLMSILPPDKTEMVEKAKKMEENYKKYIEEELMYPGGKLTPELEEEWKERKALAQEIYKDVVRTSSAFSWFVQPSLEDEERDGNPLEWTFNGLLTNPLKSRKYCALFRVLFIASRQMTFYSQGYNEMAAIILHTIATDKNAYVTTDQSMPKFTTDDMLFEALTFEAFKVVAWDMRPFHVFVRTKYDKESVKDLLEEGAKRRAEGRGNKVIKPLTKQEGKDFIVTVGPGKRPPLLPVDMTREEITDEIMVRRHPENLLECMRLLDLIITNERRSLSLAFVKLGISSFTFAASWAPTLLSKLLDPPSVLNVLDFTFSLNYLERQLYIGTKPCGAIISACAAIILECAEALEDKSTDELPKAMNILQRPPCLDSGFSLKLRYFAAKIWATYFGDVRFIYPLY